MSKTMGVNNIMKSSKIHVGILLFDGAEVLDFAGPFEFFSVADFHKEDSEQKFTVFTVSQTGDMIKAVGGLQVQPDYSFNNAPHIDLLIVPGGIGAYTQVENFHVIEWVKHVSTGAQITASVCTGAFILAKAGLLDGKSVTTHWALLDRLEKEYPSLDVKRGVKFVDQGDIITSGGISAGINMSYFLVQKLAGIDVARKTARFMAYDIIVE